MDYTSTNALSMLGGDDYTITQEQIADVDARAVHLVGTELITGAKTFQNDNFLVENAAGVDKINVSGTSTTLSNATQSMNSTTKNNMNCSVASGEANAIYATGTSGYNMIRASGASGQNFIDGKTTNSIRVDNVNKIVTTASTTTLTNTNISISGDVAVDGVLTSTVPMMSLIRRTAADRAGKFGLIIADKLAVNDFTGIGFSAYNDGLTTVPMKGGILYSRTGSFGVGKLNFCLNPSTNTSNVDISQSKMEITNTATTLTNDTIAMNGATTFDTVVSAPVAAPTLDTHLTNKLYVDTNINTVSTGLATEITNRTNADNTLQANKVDKITYISGNISSRIDSGFYENEFPGTGYPTGASSWWSLWANTHSNLTNYFSSQFASSFFSQDLYFRNTDNVGTKVWRKVITSAENGDINISGKIITTAAETDIIGNDVNIYTTDNSAGITISPNSIISLSLGVISNIGTILSDYFTTSRDLRFGGILSSVSKLLITGTTTTLNNTTTNIQSAGINKIQTNASITTMTNDEINMTARTTVLGKLNIGSTQTITLGGNWLTETHNTNNGNVGFQFPRPECGMIMTNTGSSTAFPSGFYTGVVKPLTGTTSIRQDWGVTSSLASIAVPTNASVMTPHMTMSLGGNLGIGTVAPSAKLHTVGTARFKQPLYVAVGYGATNNIVTSINGTTWLSLGKPVFDGYGAGVVHTGTRWVAVGNGTVNTLASSEDGLNWTGRGRVQFTDTCYSVSYNGLLLVAVGTGGNTIATSNDGITWTGRTNTLTTQANGVAWGRSTTLISLWIATGSGTDSITTSENGTTWTPQANLFTSGKGIANNNSLWVCVGSGPLDTIQTSPDGITWTGRGKTVFTTAGWGVVWSQSLLLWVAVGQGTNTIATSTDGITWVGQGAGLFNDYGYGIIWTGSLFIAMGGDSQTIITSTNGTAWTARTNGLEAGYAVALGDRPQLELANDRITGQVPFYQNARPLLTGTMTLTQYFTIALSPGSQMNIAGSPLMGNPAFLAVHPTNILIYAISWCSDDNFQTIASNISLDFYTTSATTLGTITAIVNTTGQYQANLTYLSTPYYLPENTGYYAYIKTTAVRTNNKAWTCVLHYYQV